MKLFSDKKMRTVAPPTKSTATSEMKNLRTTTREFEGGEEMNLKEIITYNGSQQLSRLEKEIERLKNELTKAQENHKFLSGLMTFMDAQK